MWVSYIIMGKNTFSACEEIIKNFVKGDEVGFMNLKSLITINIGGDPRTVSNAIRIMLDTKLIKDIGNSHFKIL